MGSVRPQHKEVRHMADTPWYQLGPSDANWPSATEPTRATPIGPVEEAPLAIYLGSRAMELIESHLEESPDQPFAGLLIGHPLFGSSRPFVLVTDVLPFSLPAEDEGEVRFSPQLFEELYPVWQERQQGACVVGWCHAAPKRGIALSSFQRFSHHRYFPHPWQVALIIDSDRHASLLYHWQGPELVPCDAFYYWNMDAEPTALLYDSPLLSPDEGRLEAAAAIQTQIPDRAESQPVRRAAPWWVWLLLLLFIYALIPAAPGSIGWMRMRLSQGTDRLTQLKEGLDELQNEQQVLRQQMSSAGTPSPASPAASPAREALPSTTVELSSDPAELPSETEVLPSEPLAAPFSEPALAKSVPRLEGQNASQEVQAARDYVIQPGDTMWSISRSLLGDPWAFRRLAETNEIPDPDTIFPGQRLQLPED